MNNIIWDNVIVLWIVVEKTHWNIELKKETEYSNIIQ